MTHRPQQIASNLRQAIQQVLARGLHDPRIGGLVTITNVTVAADLKTATVFVSVLPEEKEKKTMFALRDAARHIRREVGELVAMRQVPLFTFKTDAGLKREAEAYQAIARIAREREESLAATGAEGGAEGGTAGSPGDKPAEHQTDSESDHDGHDQDASSEGEDL